MEHNTAGAGSFQRRRAGSMRQTAYKKGGKARRAAGGAKAGPEEGVTLPADEAARMQCAPGLREEWGFVLGCGRCVAARGAGPLCGE